MDENKDNVTNNKKIVKFSSTGKENYTREITLTKSYSPYSFRFHI